MTTLAARQQVPFTALPTLQLPPAPLHAHLRPDRRADPVPPRATPSDRSPTDHDRLQSDAAMWRRTRRADRDVQHQHESYLAYLSFVAERRGGLHLPTAEERLGRAVAYFSEILPTDVEVRSMVQIHADTGANPYDLALAWSVGWSPVPQAGPGRCARSGEQALYALVEQVGAAIAVTARMLAERTGLSVLHRDDHSSLAAVLGLSLSGRCDCGHHVRGCTGCDRGCCFADHDLRTWDPYRCHLRPFVDQAVRGTAQARIMGGAFAGSMLFRALEREGRLLCRTVEWGCCDVCGRSFGGTRCPEAHPRGSESVRREPRKNQLIQPATEDGGHQPLRRWWCADCRHLFGAAGLVEADPARCPRCDRTPHRRMTVWARTTPSRLTPA